MWTDAGLENWRLRQRRELSRPGAGVPWPSANPSPYERVQSGKGVVRFKLKPVEVVQLPDDSVDDLWRDGEDGRD